MMDKTKLCTALYDFLNIVSMYDWNDDDTIFFDVSINESDEAIKLNIVDLKEKYGDFNVDDYDIYHEIENELDYILQGWIQISKREDSYQQRLDKVLEKFDSYGNVHYQLILEHTQSSLNDETISINYNKIDNIFYFTTDILVNVGDNNELEYNIEYKIPLETVESLIKDLESDISG